MRAVGVDGCRGGWIAVVLQDGAFAGADVFHHFAELLDANRDADAIGVDIPIGLPPPFPRRPDKAAKERLRGRATVVFLTYPREVYEAPDFRAAVTLCDARGFRPRISRQSYALGPRILEVDALVRPDDRIVEVHPEISFHHMAGRALSPKRTWAGQGERRRLLEARRIRLPDDLGRANTVPPDDVLDAAAAAWSAHRVALGEAESLPKRPDRDAQGRPVAIWC